jgi:hypothetical protein
MAGLVLISKLAPQEVERLYKHRFEFSEIFRPDFVIPTLIVITSLSALLYSRPVLSKTKELAVVFLTLAFLCLTLYLGLNELAQAIPTFDIFKWGSVPILVYILISRPKPRIKAP